jgi:hypothetical protein
MMTLRCCALNVDNGGEATPGVGELGEPVDSNEQQNKRAEDEVLRKVAEIYEYPDDQASNF